MIVVDDFLDRMPIPERYNCFDFAREVRLAHDGLDLVVYFPWLGQRFDHRHVQGSHMRRIQRSAFAIDGSFCVYQRPRSQPHIGIWWKKKVLHLPESGAIYEAQENILRRYPYVSYFL